MDKDLRAYAEAVVNHPKIGVWERMVLEALLQVYRASPPAESYALATLIEVLECAVEDEKAQVN